jgi:hypothetical protein
MLNYKAATCQPVALISLMHFWAYFRFRKPVHQQEVLMSAFTRWIAAALTLCCTSVLMAAEVATAPVETELVRLHGEGQRARIHRGVSQVAALWRTSDGDATAFASFVRENFVAEPAALDALFNRYQHNLEMLYGHIQELRRELTTPSDLDLGPIAPYDHQAHNAQQLVDVGAAILLRDPELTGERLDAELRALLAGGPERVRAMGEAARSIGRPDAADAVAAVVEAHAKRRSV